MNNTPDPISLVSLHSRFSGPYRAFCRLMIFLWVLQFTMPFDASPAQPADASGEFAADTDPTGAGRGAILTSQAPLD